MLSTDTLKAMAAGGLAGASEAITTMPFEVTKNRLQLGSGPTTIIGSMQSTVRAAGVSGLFYGLQPALVQVAGKASVRFAAFEKLKVIFSPGVAGTLAGCVEAFVWVAPTERLKVLRHTQVAALEAAKKAAADGARAAGSSASSSAIGGGGTAAAAVTTAGVGTSGSVFKAVSHIVRTQGVSSLWVGTGPTVARQGMANGIRFALFEQTKSGLESTKLVPRPLLAATAGGLTGVLSVVLTNPVDVVKTRMQASRGASVSMMATIRQTVAEERWNIFTRGMTARTCKIGLGQAVIFGVYDAAKRWLA